MVQPSAFLQEFWDQTLKNMPKLAVQLSLKEIGFTYSTAGLSEDEVRKLLFGFLAQLEPSLQEEAIKTIQAMQRQT